MACPGLQNKGGKKYTDWTLSVELSAEARAPGTLGFWEEHEGQRLYCTKQSQIA